MRIHQIFTKNADKLFYFFFSKIQIYNLLWEDSRVDLKYFTVDEHSRLLTIAAAGCGVASELAKNPQQIDAVDLNQAHLAITAFKVTAARLCRDYEEYSHLMTEGRDARFFQKYPEFYDLVPPELAGWWKKRESIITRKGLYRSGLTVVFMNMVKRLAAFDPSHWFSLNVAERLEYCRAKMRFLERLGAGFELLAPNLSMGISRHQAALLATENGSFLRAFSNGLHKYAAADRTTPFVHYIAYQRLPLLQESLPPFVQKKNFETIRASRTKVSYLHENLFAVLKRTADQHYTHVNLADAIEWMDEAHKRKLISETIRVLAPGGELLYRSVVKHSNAIEQLGFSDQLILDAEKTEAASREDESFLYEKVYFFKKVTHEPA